MFMCPELGVLHRTFQKVQQARFLTVAWKPRGGGVKQLAKVTKSRGCRAGIQIHISLVLTCAYPLPAKEQREREKERKGGADQRETQRKEGRKREGENNKKGKKKEM